MIDRINVEETSQTESVTGTPAATIDSSARYLPTLAEVTAKGRKALISPWAGATLALAVLATFLAYLFNPDLNIKLGGGYDRPYLNLAEQGFSYAIRFDYDDGQSIFVGRETGQPAGSENYRWTRSRPIILLPGVGEAAHLQLRAAANPVYPAGQRVQVLLNGREFTSFELKPGEPKLYSFEIDKNQYPAQNGNLAVEMRVTPLGQPSGKLVYARPNDPSSAYNGQTRASDYELEKGEAAAPQDGFKLYNVDLATRTTAIPPLTVALSLALAALAFYFALAYIGLVRRWAFGAAALLIGLAALMLALWRLEITVYTGRLALLMIVATLSLPVFDLTLPRLFRRWHLPLSKVIWVGLLALFLAGLYLRGGGVLYPQALVIDAPAHLLEIGKVTQGQLWEQYTNRELSKVPGQWNSSAIIPYSTISYFLLAPFAKLPLDPNISVNLVNIFLDAFRVFIIYALAVALGTGARTALVAAGIYLFVPCTWLMNSWGNWPTTISFWLAVLYVMLALVLYRSLNQKAVWFGLTALLTLTMMVYSVTTVFMVMLLYGWAFGLFFFTGRHNKLDRRNGKLIFASATLASLAAVALYYWQFLPSITLTLTSFDQSLSSGEGLGLGARDFLPYLGLYTEHLINPYGVGVLLALALVIFGWAIFAPANLKNPFKDDKAVGELRSGRNLWLMGAWFAVFAVFGIAQWKVDMVDKQVWFTVPLICALASVALRFIWEKLRQPVLSYGGRIAVITLTGWLTYSTVTLWIYRIFFKRH